MKRDNNKKSTPKAKKGDQSKITPLNLKKIDVKTFKDKGWNTKMQALRVINHPIYTIDDLEKNKIINSSSLTDQIEKLIMKHEAVENYKIEGIDKLIMKHEAVKNYKIEQPTTINYTDLIKEHINKAIERKHLTKTQADTLTPFIYNIQNKEEFKNIINIMTSFYEANKTPEAKNKQRYIWKTSLIEKLEGMKKLKSVNKSQFKTIKEEINTIQTREQFFTMLSNLRTLNIEYHKKQRAQKAQKPKKIITIGSTPATTKKEEVKKIDVILDVITEQIKENKQKAQKLNKQLKEETKGKYIQLKIKFYSKNNTGKTKEAIIQDHIFNMKLYGYDIGKPAKELFIDLKKEHVINYKIKYDHIYFLHGSNYKTGGKKTAYKLIKDILKNGRVLGSETFEEIKKRKSDYFHPLGFEIEYFDEYTTTDTNYKDHIINKPLKYTAKGFQLVNKYITKKNLKRLTLKSPKNKHVGKLNSCFYDAIISQFKTEYDKKYKEPLCYQLIKNICILPDEKQYNNNDDYSLSINQAVRFFKKIHAKLIVLDQEYNILFRYDPKEDGYSRDKRHFRSLYGEYWGEHIYHLTENIHSLKKKIKEREPLSVSNIFRINDPDELEYIYTNELSEIMKIIKLCISKDQKINIKYEGNMIELLKQIINKLLIIPKLIYTGNISHLKIGDGKQGDSDLNCNINITSLTKDGNDDHKQIKFNDKEQFKVFITFYNKIYKLLVNDKYICNYNDDTLKFFNEYSRGAVSGILPHINLDITDDEYIEYDEIDIIRAYTSILLSLKNIPVFDICDTIQIYNNDKINNNAIYLIELLEDTTTETAKNHILTDKRINRVYGEVVNKILDENIKIKIHYVLYPSRVEQIPAELMNTIYELYNSNLDNKFKKIIINYIIGTLGKKYNNKTKTALFIDKEEAINYSVYVQGFLSKISDVDINEKVKYTRSYIDDNGQETEEETIQDYTTEAELFSVSKTSKKELINGFNNFKSLIYDKMRIRMFNLFKDCEESGAGPIGIFTDAIVCKDANKWISKNNINITSGDDVNLFENIGGYKKDIKISYDLHYAKFKENQLMNFKEFTPIYNDLKDEYNLNEIFEMFERSNTGIYADYAGCGKSESAKYYMKYRGFQTDRDDKGNYTFYKSIITDQFFRTIEKQYITDEDIKTNLNGSLVITPYNTLCDDYIKSGFNAITLNILLGVHKDDNKFIKNYNIEGVNVILIDEIYTFSFKMLIKLYKFIFSHPDIRFLLTGDYNQLEEIKDKNDRQYINNDLKFKSINDKLIKMICPNILNLHIMKRYNDQETIEKIKLIKYLLIDKKDIRGCLNLLEKVNFKDIKTVSNVSYLNYTAQQLNIKIHKEQYNRNKQTFYKRGDFLICKTYNKKLHLKKNFKYEIIQVFKNAETLKLQNDRFDINITFKDAYKYFRLPYCYTAHSVKGMTLSDNITILDCETPLVLNDPKWLYTAITRCRNINNVKYCNDANFWNPARLDKIIKNMISTHRQTDIKNKKFNSYKFIDYAYIKNMIIYKINNMNKCPICDEKIEYLEKNSPNMCSIFRINNNLGHIKGNIQICCVSCNKSKK